MSHDTVILSTIVYPGTAVETDAVMLVESIRAFTGSFARVPIWCYLPQYGKQLKPAVRDRLAARGVTFIPFDVASQALRFPFIADARAASLAEARAAEHTGILVWLSANTLALQEPTDFSLPAHKHLAYCPVHHTVIGSRYEQPPDRFWALVYRHCQVSDDRIFPMMTHVDNTWVRPYFNAGILVTRPAEGLLGAWYQTFIDTYQHDEFCSLYEQDERYTVFIHQAILAGTILARYYRDQLQELPRTYNYPLHLYDDDVSGHRPSAIEECVTVRHEGFYKDAAWYDKMPAGTELKTWLSAILGTIISE